MSSLLSSGLLQLSATKNIHKNINLSPKYSYQEVANFSDNPPIFPQPKFVVSLRANSSIEWLIIVNQQPTFVVKNFVKAVMTASKLSSIMNANEFDPEMFYPSAKDELYVGKYRDEILFAIPKVGIGNPSLNLTQWINNLRVAAGVEPLTLVESQKQMHQLVNTENQMDGIASWYGPYFQGRQTASGEQFEQQDFTAAHPSLPFNTYLKVTNLQNGESVVVRINDRGPYIGDRNLDLSHAAAIALKSDEVGVVPIVATVLVPFK